MIAVFECLAGGCANRCREEEQEWEQDWPLEQRQRTCGTCGQKMWFVRVKATMPEHVKARLRAVQAERRKAARMTAEELARLEVEE